MRTDRRSRARENETVDSSNKKRPTKTSKGTAQPAKRAPRHPETFEEAIQSKLAESQDKRPCCYQTSADVPTTDGTTVT